MIARHYIDASKNGCDCIRSCGSKKIERRDTSRREKHGGGLGHMEIAQVKNEAA
jgi:hypothetical protein